MNGMTRYVMAFGDFGDVAALVGDYPGQQAPEPVRGLPADADFRGRFDE
jgi:hypothetical protein